MRAVDGIMATSSLEGVSDQILLNPEEATTSTRSPAAMKGYNFGHSQEDVHTHVIVTNNPA
jgi:hypothetical protein